jgi:hypothetical protein
MLVSWLVIVLPVLIAIVAVFAPAPEAGGRFGLRWRVTVALLSLLTAGLAWKQQLDDAKDKRKLVEAIEDLKKVSPLRKQAAELAKELLEFYEQREHYNDRFKPGQTLSAAETKSALRWYEQSVRLYHQRYEKRVIATLDEIHSATGMTTDVLHNDAAKINYAGGIQDVANRLSALAASLP